MTPVEFLTARLDELEAKARAALEQRPLYDTRSDKTAHGEVCQLAAGEGAWGAILDFVGALTPEAVLADIAAKRAIIAVHHSFAVEDDGTPDPYASAEETLWCAGCGFNGVEEYRCLLEECPTLRALIQAFADHPDFDSAWRP